MAPFHSKNENRSILNSTQVRLVIVPGGQFRIQFSTDKQYESRQVDPELETDEHTQHPRYKVIVAEVCDICAISP